MSAEPMDRADLRILADLLAIYDTVDPMPDMLPDLVLFGLNAHKPPAAILSGTGRVG